jgi:antitoxin (DNA-binding transcriptional repressor) of toxin-antitoxin stability system
MKQVNIREALHTLSKLVAAAEAGEEIVIARAGRPVARLIRHGGIRFGVRKGLIKRMTTDFDAPLTAKELERLFASPVEP